MTSYTDEQELLNWFTSHQLIRMKIECSVEGDIAEEIAPPILFLGTGIYKAVKLPHPHALRYEKPLAEMDLPDFHIFLLEWLTRAIDDGLGACYVCGKTVSNNDTQNPWDGIFIDKEIAAWFVIHFDCKRGLHPKTAGLTPFEISLAETPILAKQ